MTHLAIAEKDNGIAVTWQDQVTEQDYQAALINADLPLEAVKRAPAPTASNRCTPVGRGGNVSSRLI
jgi:hypothetical protein